MQSSHLCNPRTTARRSPGRWPAWRRLPLLGRMPCHTMILLQCWQQGSPHQALRHTAGLLCMTWHVRRQADLHLSRLVVARHAGDRDMAARSSLMTSAWLGRQQVHLLYCSQHGRPATLPGSFSYVPCSAQRLQSSACTGSKA